MKLLLHACCAPCSVYCVDTLRKEGIEPTMYWFNPNIHPFKEYVARRDCFKDFCEKQNLKCIIEDNYGLDEFCKNVSNDINARCVNYCYPIRMRRVFEFAKENGYDTVSTTLLYSIYQKHDYIKKLCEDLSKEFGIDFLYRDFRVGFEEGHQKAYEMGLYLQKYCGCVFSEEDRYNNPNPPKPELPEGCEYPSRRNVCIKKIEHKEEYMELLLDADPSRDSINKYLNDSDVYGLQVEEDIVSIAVISHIDKNTLELKNLATKEEYRGKGYAKRLLKSLCGNYKQKYDKMLVVTSENNIPFYVKQGFDKYEKTIKNYFVDNYDEEIWDGDLQCIDMYYYSKELKKQ
jgi:predicted adenine nucleotide alpha hydrolase (AANH) superfamily ATPase/N-acetylglutamate synthase-like GNAT family acetyltransferase